MQTKDIIEKLGITREKIKYYKKEGVFVPEGKTINGRTEYTERDYRHLERLTVLTKSGLSCADIRKIQAETISLKNALIEQIRSFSDEIQRMQASIELASEIIARDEDYENLNSAGIMYLIRARERAGVNFMDYDDADYSPISMLRSIECPVCGKQFDVDLSDYVYDESGSEKENGMGPDTVYSFDTDDCCTCPFCDEVIRLKAGFENIPSGLMTQKI
ncbi:MAG: MerR family transcriptional regulator [Clostridia bacterium]|nr:MerR family transcriptional regulator [Clostridia bacterium]